MKIRCSAYRMVLPWWDVGFSLRGEGHDVGLHVRVFSWHLWIGTMP